MNFSGIYSMAIQTSVPLPLLFPPRNVFLLFPGPLQLPRQLGTLRHLSGPQSESHITPHPRGEPHVSPHHKFLY